MHPTNELSALKVKNLKAAGRYVDGNGLYLVVDATGAKRWLLRIVVQGRRRDMGLGSATLVSLAEARQAAIKYRKIARDGGDPFEERRAKQTSVPTFAEAARHVHAASKSTWKNPKHAQQWINTLETYAIPHIGKMHVDQVKSADILRVLSPIWLVKAETARRVRQRLKAVFDWASTAGFRTEENPVVGIERGLPRQNAKPKHHAAMAYAEVPAFVRQLQRNDPRGIIARRALELLILTASRTSEVLKAQWSEVNFQTRVWTVPAERMKAGVEHRIPLSPRSLELLTEVRSLNLAGELIFPGARAGRPMSNMVFTTSLKRMNMPVTAHGFRSSFRDWVAETTDFPNELAEMALAHTIGNKVEAAYRRGDMMDRRRKLMDAWDGFLQLPAPIGPLSL